MSAKTGMGTLYGASLGPGNPGLITRQVWDLLQGGERRWAYPVRRSGAPSHALGIAERAGLVTPEGAMPLIFPMTHDTEILTRYWLRAGQHVLSELEQGRDVVFLVEGDASTYSTFGHLARTVRGLNPEIVIETLAGVPSHHAAAAALNFPLTDTDDTLALVPASYGIDWLDRVLGDFDTLVLLKVKPLLDELIDWLEGRGLLDHALFMEKAGTPEERIERQVSRLRGQKVNYLSLLLVRNPLRQRGAVQRGCRKKTSDS
jgi:precorrin-2 C20-methyltransferase (EC 2.1.1.130)/cobalt-factor II C20-methyltransferase (EC 2.1.1.151)